MEEEREKILKYLRLSEDELYAIIGMDLDKTIDLSKIVYGYQISHKGLPINEYNKEIKILMCNIAKRVDEFSTKGKDWFLSNKRKIQDTICNNQTVHEWVLSNNCNIELVIAILNCISMFSEINTYGKIAVSVLIAKFGINRFCVNEDL